MIIVYLLALLLVIPVLIIQEVLSNKTINNRKNRYSIVSWYVIFILVMIAGLRDTASISLEFSRQSDEFAYRQAFNLLIGAPFSLSNIISFEWGRYFLDWTLANLFKDSQMWVFTYALISNVLFVKAIKRYVKPFWFGVFLFITLGLLSFQMNGTTTVLASAILLQGIDHVIERKFWRYFVVVFIAAGIHFSAWIMLPLYFLLTKKSFTKATPIWFVVSLVFMFGFNSIANFILPKTPYSYYLYQINSDQGYGVNIFRVLSFSVIYIFILYFTKKIKNFTVIDRYFTNMVIVLLSMNIASLAYVYIYRFNELFIFAIIYLLPRVIYSFRVSIRYSILIIIIITFFVFGLQQTWNVLYENILFKW